MGWLTGPASLHRLYWLGIYEKYTVHTMPWMFERDYFSGVWSIISLLWALATAGARQSSRECCVFQLTKGVDSQGQTPSRRSTRQD